MNKTAFEPPPLSTLPTRVTPARAGGPHPLGAATLATLLTAATLILLAALWFLVGRPVEDLTGALIDGLAADAFAFCLVAAPAAAIGMGIARLAART